MKYLMVLFTLTVLFCSSVFAQDVSTGKTENKELNPCKKPKKEIVETQNPMSFLIEVPEGFRVTRDPVSGLLSGSSPLSSNRISKDANQPPVIEKLILSKNEVIYGSKDEKSRFIDVEIKATDPENDILIYYYTVSIGRIIGQGAKVKWDLCGAEPGTYTITATIDDGCGVCAEPKTETVDVIANTKNKSKTQVPQ